MITPGSFGRVIRVLSSGAMFCLLMTGCAMVPTTGPVVPGDGGDVSADPYGGYVRLLPAGPQLGVAPEGLVNGFLKDMGSFEEDHKAARSYMLPELREEWSPDSSVQVFQDLDTVDFDSEISADGLTATVRIRSSLVATIDEDGKYLPNDDDGLFEVPFHLAREGGDPEGEWRIQDMPEELILSQLDVERTHRPLNLYYFNPEGSALVPDPVYLPVSSEELTERLLRRLIAGPSDWLEPAVRSAFPGGTLPSMEVDNERVEIDVGVLGQSNAAEMGAQIAWTLRQLPEIQEFSLIVNGEEVAFPDTEGESKERPRPVDDFWSEVAPGAISLGTRAYYVNEGRLWSATDWEADTFNDAERVPGPLGAGDVQLERFAISVDESTIAGIPLGGDEVVAGRTDPGADYEEVLDDGYFTGLSWDVNGNLWVLEETDDPDEREDDEDTREEESELILDDRRTPPGPGDSTLWLLRGGEEVVRVSAPELNDRSLVDLKVSRDGTRVAAITEEDGERSLELGRVTVDGDQVTVGGFIELARELEEVLDVSWRSADQLVILGSRDRGTSQAFLVSLDGGTPPASTGTSVAGMVTISGAPGQPLIAGTDDGSVWISNDRLSWQNVAEGTAPTFPG